MLKTVQASRLVNVWDEGIAFGIADNEDDIFLRNVRLAASGMMLGMLVAFCLSIR